MQARQRHNVQISGRHDAPVLLFAHGFGCDQSMWRHIAPRFADSYRVVTFDHVGSGGSDRRAYDPIAYDSLDRYAADIVDLCDELELDRPVFVGHSVAAMIGVLAETQRPGIFSSIVMIGPSPRYLDDDGYRGGFSAEDIGDLLQSIESNYLGWSSAMALPIMGNAEHPEHAAELEASFCRTDPVVAATFARATFLSDNRADLSAVQCPVLVLQCAADVIAPEEVGVYVAAALPDAEFVRLQATGYCPQVSSPTETYEVIRDFVDRMTEPVAL